MKKISEIIESATIMNKKLDNFQRLVKTLNLNSQKNLYDIVDIKEQIILSSILTPQSKSIIHQKLIEQKFNLTKVSAKLEMGDSVGLDNKYYEIKCSTPSVNGNKLHLVQIRPHHNVDFYICAFIDDVNYEENYIFILNKTQMSNEIAVLGGNAHGVGRNKINNREYRLTLNLDNEFNKHFIRWVKNYRDVKKEELFFS